jgi:Ca2+ transporting ATPase
MEVEARDVKIEMPDRKAVDKSKYFNISRRDIRDIFTAYQQRSAVKDEFDLLNQYGGDKGLAKLLKTDLETGLESAESQALQERAEDFGENRFEEEPLKHFCVHVWEAFGDLFLQILIGAALVQIVLGATVSDDPKKDWIDGLAIVLAIVVVVSVASITNYQKDKKFKELNDTNKNTISFTIYRRFKYSINPEDLLVGDIVQLGQGMIIPADGIIVSGSIKTDESTLTGESRYMEKKDLENCLKQKDSMHSREEFENLASPMVYSGTEVTDGQAQFMVLSVGKYTITGEIRENVIESQDAEDSKTPLEEKLENLATFIGYFGLGAAIITLIALFIQFGVTHSAKSSKFEQSSQKQALLKQFAINFDNQTLVLSANSTMINPSTQVSGSILNIFLLCVAIIVVSIPEGLPLAVTLTLAFSIGKMMKENNLVRKLKACETMGGANYICTDKTGTLTRNIMSVVRIFDMKNDKDLEKITINNEKKPPKDSFPQDTYYNLLKNCIVLNIEVQFDENGKLLNANKSDQGLIDLFQIFSENIFQTRLNYLGPKPKFSPFNSERKRMCTFAKNSEFPTGYRLLMKGAPDVLLKMTKYKIDPDSGNQIELVDEDKLNILKQVDKYGDLTLRTLAICYKEITEEEFSSDVKVDESGLTIVAIVGIRDSLREGVSEAVQKCSGAGITTVMVTGDLLNTAVAIAKQCHIIDKDTKTEGTNIAILGEDFFNKIGGLECATCNKNSSDCKCPRTQAQASKIKDPNKKNLKKDRIRNMEEFRKIASNIRVIARCRPLDKYALVLGLRCLDNVVAVTGDGTNDAMALSKSDVGFSMGIQGTEIAKQASDIIIMDDNFASIVTAVKWGRNIFDNIRKFIQFQLAVNLCACLLVFITACIGNETPLKPIQMLWVNLIMDSLGSLALATEPPHNDLLLRQPYKRKEKIINLLMWKHILLQAMFSLGLLLFLYLQAPYFIMEDSKERIEVYIKLVNCFGIDNFPGQKPVISGGSYSFNIIHGSSAYWNPDAVRLPGCNDSDWKEYANLALAYKGYSSKYGATAHMTIVFNVFVIYTLFNQFNARVIDDSFNIFFNLHNNIYFIIVTAIELGLHALLIEFASNAFKVAQHGLTGTEWGICIGFGALTFLVSIVAKMIPLEKLLAKFLKTEDDEDLEEIKEKDQNPHDQSVNHEDKVLNAVNDPANINKRGSIKNIADNIVKKVSNRAKDRVGKTASISNLKKDKENI